MVLDALIAFLFGFPGAFLSLLLSAVGILKNKYGLVLIGVLLFTPFTYYLYGAPGAISDFVILLPLLQLGSALAVFKNNKNRECHPERSEGSPLRLRDSHLHCNKRSAAQVSVAKSTLPQSDINRTLLYLAWLLLAPSILMVLWVVSVVLIYSSGITEGAG